MGKRFKAFIVGFTGAFTPTDYTEFNKLGETTNKINQRFSQLRFNTYEQINKQISQANKAK